MAHKPTAAKRSTHPQPAPKFNWKPPPIPSGYYDPALDAQRAAAQRGFEQYQQATGLAGTRAAEDYGFQTGDIRQQYARSLADLTQSRDRGVTDIGTSRTYENQNYGRSTMLLGQQFSRLANTQRQQQAMSGIVSGGIALQAAQKRAFNQGQQQQGLDITHTRSLAGLDTRQQRLLADYATQSGRLGEDQTSALGRALLGYERGVSDRATGLATAGGENVAFGLDTEAERAYQAQQAGYIAPKRPTLKPPPQLHPVAPKKKGKKK